MSDRLAAIRKTLEDHGQTHLLGGFADLSPEQASGLLDQIEGIDFGAVSELIRSHVLQAPDAEVPADLEPATYFPQDPGAGYDAAHYRRVGEDLIRSGRVAAFTVAGGQGTRLGWNGPKGTYPGTPITGKPLFRLLAEQLTAAEGRYGVTVPWYIMTSPMNDAQTRAFFTDNNCFGLSRKNVFMFPQGVMPSIDPSTGHLLLADEATLAVNPDGHGGSIKALRDSGAIEDMRARGVEHISYFQIDNPLVRVVDPVFLGLHASAPGSSAEMSSKMVAKTDPNEKVGVFCESRGKTMVIEYSDLPAQLAEERRPDGTLRINAANIAIHLLGVQFVEQLTPEGGHFGLPYHRAVKKVPFFDPDARQMVDPDAPNAVKLETFVFDALPLAEGSIVYETSRVEEFAPIKNSTGADSPATSYQLQFDRNGAWLEQHGVEVPRDAEGHVTARVEISPLTAMEASDLTTADLPTSIAAGEALVL